MSGPLASRREDLLPDDIDDPELLLRALARFPRFPRLLCSRKCCGNMGKSVEIGGKCHAKVRKYQFEPGP